jgi:4-hydroxybenzoate polyprenyltransferase
VGHDCCVCVRVTSRQDRTGGGVSHGAWRRGGTCWLAGVPAGWTGVCEGSPVVPGASTMVTCAAQHTARHSTFQRLQDGHTHRGQHLHSTPTPTQTQHKLTIAGKPSGMMATAMATADSKAA